MTQQQTAGLWSAPPAGSPPRIPHVRPACVIRIFQTGGQELWG